MHRLEEDLRPRVDAHFRQRGFRTHHEVHLLERWIDVVAVKEEVVAIELKIRDWREALKQAVMYQLAADYSVVAMPWENAFTAHRHRWRFEADGVGLLAVRGEEIRMILEPEYSVRKLPWLTELLRAEAPVTKRLPRNEVEGFTTAAKLPAGGWTALPEPSVDPPLGLEAWLDPVPEAAEPPAPLRPPRAPRRGTGAARGAGRARRGRSRRR